MWMMNWEFYPMLWVPLNRPIISFKKLNKNKRNKKMVLGERSFHQQPKKKIKKTKTKWYSIDDHSLSSIKAMPMPRSFFFFLIYVFCFKDYFIYVKTHCTCACKLQLANWQSPCWKGVIPIGIAPTKFVGPTLSPYHSPSSYDMIWSYKKISFFWMYSIKLPTPIIGVRD